MFRILALVAVLTVGCGDDAVHHPPDAPDHDAAVHDAAGSAVDAVATIEAHPRDAKLELLVLGVSVVVVAGPVRRRRRREDDATRRT